MIDILLATYNGERYIKDQLDSLLNQTYKNFRVVVHDDGSNDNTLDIVRDYMLHTNLQIFILEDGVKCGGAARNFFHLLNYSDAEYVMFCDQDDIWYSNKVELSLKRIIELESVKENIPVVVYTDMMVVDESLSVISDSMHEYQKLHKSPSFQELLVRNPVTGCTMLVNRTLLSFFDTPPDDIVMHDWWLALLCKKNGGVLSLIDAPMMLYRQHGGNSVGAQRANVIGFITRMFSSSWFLGLRMIYRQAKSFTGISILDFGVLKVRVAASDFIRSL